jgi:hypothetical protein
VSKSSDTGLGPCQSSIISYLNMAFSYKNLNSVPGQYCQKKGVFLYNREHALNCRSASPINAYCTDDDFVC